MSNAQIPQVLAPYGALKFVPLATKVGGGPKDSSVPSKS
jgi:hypothetical protein